MPPVGAPLRSLRHLILCSFVNQRFCRKDARDLRLPINTSAERMRKILGYIVASYLVFYLNIDWRVGADWFESLLLDHDVCALSPRDLLPRVAS